MKLVYYKGDEPNFGDELNTYMWPQILPQNFLDNDDSELFIGIGSILWDFLPKEPQKFVMGSGFAGYTAPPNVHDGSWDVAFVRGPWTASQLELPRQKAICDSAILLRTMDLPGAGDAIEAAFMPHFDSLQRGVWEKACDLAGIRLIDPRGDVETIISEIKSAKVLVTEAMHGAIVADALRTPWIAAKPIQASHHSKWYDWSDALSIDLKFNNLRPTNSMEAYVGLSRGRGKIDGRAGRVSNSLIAQPINKALTYWAAEGLKKMTKLDPQLSSDTNITNATDAAHNAVQNFVLSRRKVA
ncbi:MAG: polysaccharide pyruvyl transferase family protein [Hyphomicrobiales bacterium]